MSESKSEMCRFGDRTPPEPIAILSDVHGNLRALDAVLEDIDRQGIRDIVHLGDVVYGPLDPRGTAARMIERGIPSVRGNEDRLVAFPEGENPTVDFARSSLRSEHLQWLCEFPLSMTRDGLFLCHGTPRDDAAYLLTDVTPSGVRLRTEETVAALVSEAGAPIVLCGHDHLPRVVRLSMGTMIVNPGSVGCPAYEDDQPAPHAIENGSPHARYAILAPSGDGWRCVHVSIAYDWVAAAAEAARHGRLDWASALATGWVPRSSRPPIGPDGV